jgi:hypothetical protein
MGKPVFVDDQVVADELDSTGDVLRLPPGDPPNDLHDHAVEALHRQLRKVTKSKAVFPNPESLRKMLFLAAEYISK